MAGPDSHDLAAVLDAVRRLGALGDVNRFGACALAELAMLVPFDHGVFNEIDPTTRHARFDVHPPDAPAPSWSFDTYDRYLPRNPIFQHVQRTGDGAARRLSDFVDQRELHALPLYRDILEPLGIEYQTAFSVAYRRPLILAFSLNRRNADFSDDEVALLDLIRPHLSRIHRRLRSPNDPNDLPTPRLPTAVSPAARTSRYERTFGLTPREAQILDELVEGSAVDAIATHLAIAEATVRKHIEHLYRKLGVANRAEAMALASRATRNRSV